MRQLLIALLLPFAATGQSDASLESSLAAWQDRLAVPGMAWAIVEDGAIVASGQRGRTRDGEPFTLETPLRFASISKSIAGTLLAIGETEGKLRLDEPACQRIASLCNHPDITLRHLAAHVSEGEPGTVYVYGSARFARLGQALTDAFDADDYTSLVRERITQPLGMQWFDSPHLGAHAGLVSTVRDMARYASAFDTGALASDDIAATIEAPFPLADGRPGPVSLGWFSQKVGGVRILWSFGQDDPDHSGALLLRVPDRQLALVVLANGNAISDAFRLLMGDVRYSPLAVAFLDARVPTAGQAISPAIRAASGILANALIGRYESAGAAFETWQEQHGNDLDDRDLVQHFLLTSIGGALEVDSYRTHDDRVVANAPGNRWPLLASGEYRLALGDDEVARGRFGGILALDRQADDFLGRLFRAWALRGMAQGTAEPARALAFVEQALALGVGGGTQAQLEAMAAELGR